jgi:hypothetical protein
VPSVGARNSLRLMASSYSHVPPGVFVGVGNPLLDIAATVDEDFLRKYDITFNSASMAEERHLPLFQEMMDRFVPQFTAGGASQNTVRVVQWMIGVPGVTSFIGCIGRDEYGSILKQCAAAAGVNACYVEVSSFCERGLIEIFTWTNSRTNTARPEPVQPSCQVKVKELLLQTLQLRQNLTEVIWTRKRQRR